MKRIHIIFIAYTVLISLPVHAYPLEKGKASGTFTLDGKAVTLTSASADTEENLFDSSKQDKMISLSDAQNTPVLTLRIDGEKLVNVQVRAKGGSDITILPGQWFEFKKTGELSGTLKLASRKNEGNTYECSVEYSAAAVAKPVAAVEEAEPTPEPTPTLPPATTTNLSNKSLTELYVAEMIRKDENQALKIVKLGLDPNSKDQYGIPVLNWAVMNCMPKVVKALVDKGADLKFERVPGFTIMQEAGACPDAAKILSAAGAK